MIILQALDANLGIPLGFGDWGRHPRAEQRGTVARDRWLSSMALLLDFINQAVAVKSRLENVRDSQNGNSCTKSLHSRGSIANVVGSRGSAESFRALTCVKDFSLRSQRRRAMLRVWQINKCQNLISNSQDTVSRESRRWRLLFCLMI